MDIAPDVSDSPKPTTATTTGSGGHRPCNTVAEIVSSVVDAVLSPFAASTAPGEPAQTPALWTLAAFARREFERAFSNPQPTVNPVAGPSHQRARHRHPDAEWPVDRPGNHRRDGPHLRTRRS